MTLQVRDLGRMAYDAALALQRETHARVLAGRETGDGAMTLLLVEHDPPVITVSRRPGARRHLVATPEQIAAAGVTVAETDRGGDITYHGPGQIVAYPILDLNRLGLRLHSYLRFLEQVAIDTLATHGIAGDRDAEATGVWVGPRDAGPSRKICAMGVRVARWVTMHGLALNVTTNLDHFDLIVPCGLTGRTVTSMQRELGADCPTIDDVRATLVETFHRAVVARPGSAADRIRRGARRASVGPEGPTERSS
jgi:lipoyl(octanoyl) transferase